MSEIRYWPQCMECSLRQAGAWVPVEEYSVDDDYKPPLGCYKRFVVIGRCSHGRNYARGSVQEQRSETIDVPYWWGEAHVKAAIAALKFFTPGDTRPGHGMVTRI